MPMETVLRFGHTSSERERPFSQPQGARANAYDPDATSSSSSR